MTDERRREEGVGDAAVDAAWRRAAHEEPPAHVDDAIVAAARAEARGNLPPRRSAGQKPRWIPWQPLAAAAGVIGLSFLLVQMLPRDELPPPVSPTVPAPGPAAASKELPAVQRAPAANDAADSRRVDRSPLAGAAPRAATQAAAEASTASDAPPSPEAWASHIASLHAAGDLAGAAAELRAFRAAYPDADRYLPAELRAWAASEGRADSP